MTSLLDPKYDEEEELDESYEKWYAVIIYDDASGIWHLSEHNTKDAAMAELRERVFDSIGGSDEHDEESDVANTYQQWSLSDMNDYLTGEHDINTVFCKKGGTE